MNTHEYVKARRFFNEVRELVNLINYKPGWTINVHMDNVRANSTYIQLGCEGRDATTGEHAPWVSGKRYISPFSCKQEIVGAVFALIKDAETHEMHEWFRYKGASIFNPHLDPDALVQVASKRENFVFRKDSMTNA